MSYPSSKRRLRPARGVAALVAALIAGGAGLAALPSAHAVPTPSGAAGTIQTMGGRTFNFQQGGYGPEEVLGTQSQFSNPRGMGFSPTGGDVYITDALNNRVRRISADGVVHLVAGSPSPADGPAAIGYSGDGGPATSATMWEPHGVAVDSAGNIYIADSRNCVIRMVDPTGTITTFAGTGAQAVDTKNCLPTQGDPDGPAKTIALDTPKSIFISKIGGIESLYITDSGNNEIRKIDLSGTAAGKMVRLVGNQQSKRFGGDGGDALSAQLRHAEGLWVATDGTMYISDGGNNLVRKVAMPVGNDPRRIITTIAGDQTAANTNAASGSIKQLVGDSSGDGGQAVNAHLDGPRGIAGDNAGNLYIAEEHGSRIRRINLVSGIIDTIAGDGTASPQGGGSASIKGENGPGLATQFNFIHDIEINPADGSLWIADSKNNRVRAIADPADAPGAVVPTGGNVTTTTTAPVVQVPGGSKSGYWMLGNDGKVFAFGDARSATFGDASAFLPAGAKAVHMEPTPTGRGYWINDDRGGVYAFGDAAMLGRIESSALQVNESVTSLSATPSGGGYWIFTSKGRVFPFGNASSFGDLAAKTLNGAIQSSVPTPTGKGYYMVGSDGGVFAFGDAFFWGSMGSAKLNKPVMSVVPTKTNKGYWLVASDGGIFAFGDAGFRGSMGDKKLNKPVVGMVRYGNGYLMVAADGGIFSFSEKGFAGSLGDNPPARPIAFAATLDL